jgi:hypothetical protein
MMAVGNEMGKVLTTVSSTIRTARIVSSSTFILRNIANEILQYDL